MELKRELGLRDVTLFAVSCIVGTRWIAAAAHAGPGAVLGFVRIGGDFDSVLEALDAFGEALA